MISLEGFPLSIGVKIWQPWVSGSKCSLKVPVAYARYLPVTGDHFEVRALFVKKRRYLTGTLKHLLITKRYLARSTGTLRLHLSH